MSLSGRLAERLQIGFIRKVPLLLQSEAAECGLACVAMVAEYWGHELNLTQLRSEFSISLNGSTLHDLSDIARKLDLSSRPVKLDLEDVHRLQTPCILHWDLNHFVVLVKVTSRYYYIHDPMLGRRRLNRKDFSEHFTGVALELSPLDSLETQKHTMKRPKLSEIFGRPRRLARSLFQIFVLAILLELCLLSSSFLPQIVLDQILPSKDQSLLQLVIFGFGFLLLIRVVTNFVRGWTVMAVSASFNLQWRSRVFDHLLRLPLPFFEKRNLGDIASRFDSLDVIEESVTKQVVEVVLDGMMSLGALGMLLLYDVKIAAVAVGSVLIYSLFRQSFFNKLKDLNLEFILSSAREKTYFLETVRGVQSIRLFDSTANRMARWQNLLVDERNADIRQQKFGLSFEALSTLVFGIEGLIIVYIGTKGVLDAKLTAGMLITTLAFKDQFSSRVSGFVDQLFELRMLSLHMERVGDVVLSDLEEDTDKTQNSVSTDSLLPSIDFNNVSFRYADNESFILKNVTFSINSGESVAICGPSGCGKTTLAKLMLRTIIPTSGEIRIGGVPLNSVSLSDYRALLGPVMQDDMLYAGSIAENISFFDLEKHNDRIINAAMLAAINEDIEKLPMGYETLVGELGNTLSGGQRQRVMIARALYKKPSILIFDEATSHLDQEKENDINSMIQKLDFTRILIAHRPSTISSADRVINLKEINEI